MSKWSLNDDTIQALQSAVSNGLTGFAINTAIQILVPMGFGAAQATGIMRQFYPGFKMDDWGDLWYRPYMEERFRRKASVIGMDTDIPINLFMESPLNRPTRFGYLVSYNITDLDGNEIGKNYAWLFSDTKYTKNGAINAFLDLRSQTDEYASYLSSNYNIELVKHNEGYDWGNEDWYTI